MSGTVRWSGAWSTPVEPVRAAVDVLIPTVGRDAELATTLAGLAGQDDPAFRVVVSDQSTAGIEGTPAIAAMLRVLRAQGRDPIVLRHAERRGLAEQRQFLLEQATAPAVLYLDDDVWLEPGTIARMLDALRTTGAGFVGSAVQGLSFMDDHRPQELAAFEPWEDRVEPERVRRDTPEHERWRLHNAANPTHLAAQTDVERGGWLAYHVAWVGGCVLYDHTALLDAGGFAFWTELPSAHAGEDVVAQWRVMERRGGAGILPSGAVHLEAPTTVVDRRTDAPDVIFSETR